MSTKKPCATCGKIFKRKPKEFPYKFMARKTCSRECALSLMSAIKLGAARPPESGGLPRLHPDLVPWHRMIQGQQEPGE